MARAEKDWQQRPPRHEVKLLAAGRRKGGDAFRIHVADMSYDGCQIVSDEPLSIGESIFVIVPRMGEIFARVKWVNESRAGLSFLLQERRLDQANPIRTIRGDR